MVNHGHNIITPFNFFAGAGFLVEDAQFFTTRAGRPKVTFRMVSPRDPRLPKKQPENGDYYTVVALGDRFVALVEHLRRGTPVVVLGCVQSRDVEMNGSPRTVNEIAAEAVYIVQPVGLDAEAESRTKEEVGYGGRD